MLELINNLSESRSFRNKDSIAKLDEQRSRDLLFAHVAVLLGLIQDDNTREGAIRYLSKSIAFNNFDFFRSSGNDLYMLGHAQQDYKYFDEKDLIRFVRSVIMGNYSFIYSYLNRLHTSLKVKDHTFTSFKRYSSYWTRMSDSEKKRALDAVMFSIRKDMPNSELYQLVRGR